MIVPHVRVQWGEIVVHAWSSPQGIAALHLGELPAVATQPGSRPVPGIEIESADEPLADLAKALAAYLQGRPLEWNGALDVRGVPGFALQVYERTREIPWGKVATYGDIAKSIGKPRAVRAVGTALHRNPFPIVVPCHRVIQKGGKLGGFACGIAMKRRLLALESGQGMLPFAESGE
ncbi:MAG TPA: MGMT family protein [bacterium]|nr:MGMT family protein [bacterium]